MTEDDLRRRVDRHEDKLDALSTVPGALIEINNRLSETDRRLLSMHAENDRRLIMMETSLKANTEVTQQIRDAQVAGKLLGKFLIWVGAISTALGALGAFLYQLTHGGKMP